MIFGRAPNNIRGVYHIVYMLFNYLPYIQIFNLQYLEIH